MNNDLISIIVPVYNTNNDYFRKRLNLVLKQTYKNWECIVVSNGSTDENIGI
ncbi:MAG: glycosyltransferase [Rickettsiales bacterium]|jgi:glycosyltransferase involved in cell wall biosynthesis|nr:glycosyltransferase [Rickettsiales bacterium]